MDLKTVPVDAYAHMFATGMKTSFARRAYVELFAGPGMSWVRPGGPFVKGSAIRALGHEFTDFVLNDLDPRAVDALTKRAAGDPRVHVLRPTDCNEAIADIRALIPGYALTMAFVDPTNWQISLDAIRRLAEGRRVDLVMTFHTGAMRRVGMVPAPRLDAFFGTDQWRKALGLSRIEKVDALLELYNRQLEPMGYEAGSWKHRLAVTNSHGVAMYQLVAFSKSWRGIDFWQKALDTIRPAPGTLWNLG